MDRDIVGEVAAELKLSRRKTLAVLDLYDAKCAEPSEEKEAWKREMGRKLLSDISPFMFMFKDDPIVKFSDLEQSEESLGGKIVRLPAHNP